MSRLQISLDTLFLDVIYILYIQLCFQSKEERILELETENAILHLRLAEVRRCLPFISDRLKPVGLPDNYLFWMSLSLLYLFLISPELSVFCERLFLYECAMCVFLCVVDTCVKGALCSLREPIQTLIFTVLMR